MALTPSTNHQLLEVIGRVVRRTDYGRVIWHDESARRALLSHIDQYWPQYRAAFTGDNAAARDALTSLMRGIPVPAEVDRALKASGAPNLLAQVNSSVSYGRDVLASLDDILREVQRRQNRGKTVYERAQQDEDIKFLTEQITKAFLGQGPIPAWAEREMRIKLERVMDEATDENGEVNEQKLKAMLSKITSGDLLADAQKYVQDRERLPSLEEIRRILAPYVMEDGRAKLGDFGEHEYQTINHSAGRRRFLERLLTQLESIYNGLQQTAEKRKEHRKLIEEEQQKGYDFARSDRIALLGQELGLPKDEDRIALNNEVRRGISPQQNETMRRLAIDNQRAIGQLSPDAGGQGSEWHPAFRRPVGEANRLIERLNKLGGLPPDGTVYAREEPHTFENRAQQNARIKRLMDAEAAQRAKAQADAQATRLLVSDILAKLEPLARSYLQAEDKADQEQLAQKMARLVHNRALQPDEQSSLSASLQDLMKKIAGTDGAQPPNLPRTTPVPAPFPSGTPTLDDLMAGKNIRDLEEFNRLRQTVNELRQIRERQESQMGKNPFTNIAAHDPYLAASLGDLQHDEKLRKAVAEMLDRFESGAPEGVMSIAGLNALSEKARKETLPRLLAEANKKAEAFLAQRFPRANRSGKDWADAVAEVRRAILKGTPEGALVGLAQQLAQIQTTQQDWAGVGKQSHTKGGAVEEDVGDFYEESGLTGSEDENLNLQAAHEEGGLSLGGHQDAHDSSMRAADEFSEGLSNLAIGLGSDDLEARRRILEERLRTDFPQTTVVPITRNAQGNIQAIWLDEFKRNVRHWVDQITPQFRGGQLSGYELSTRGGPRPSALDPMSQLDKDLKAARAAINLFEYIDNTTLPEKRSGGVSKDDRRFWNFLEPENTQPYLGYSNDPNERDEAYWRDVGEDGLPLDFPEVKVPRFGDPVKLTRQMAEQAWQANNPMHGAMLDTLLGGNVASMRGTEAGIERKPNVPLAASEGIVGRLLSGPGRFLGNILRNADRSTELGRSLHTYGVDRVMEPLATWRGNLTAHYGVRDPNTGDTSSLANYLTRLKEIEADLRRQGRTSPADAVHDEYNRYLTGLYQPLFGEHQFLPSSFDQMAEGLSALSYGLGYREYGHEFRPDPRASDEQRKEQERLIKVQRELANRYLTQIMAPLTNAASRGSNTPEEQMARLRTLDELGAMWQQHGTIPSGALYGGEEIERMLKLGKRTPQQMNDYLAEHYRQMRHYGLSEQTATKGVLRGLGFTDEEIARFMAGNYANENWRRVQLQDMEKSPSGMVRQGEVGHFLEQTRDIYPIFSPGLDQGPAGSANWSQMLPYARVAGEQFQPGQTVDVIVPDGFGGTKRITVRMGLLRDQSFLEARNLAQLLAQKYSIDQVFPFNSQTYPGGANERARKGYGRFQRNKELLDLEQRRNLGAFFEANPLNGGNSFLASLSQVVGADTNGQYDPAAIMRELTSRTEDAQRAAVVRLERQLEQTGGELSRYLLNERLIEVDPIRRQRAIANLLDQRFLYGHGGLIAREKIERTLRRLDPNWRNLPEASQEATIIRIRQRLYNAERRMLQSRSPDEDLVMRVAHYRSILRQFDPNYQDATMFPGTMAGTGLARFEDLQRMLPRKQLPAGTTEEKIAALMSELSGEQQQSAAWMGTQNGTYITKAGPGAGKTLTAAVGFLVAYLSGNLQLSDTRFLFRTHKTTDRFGDEVRRLMKRYKISDPALDDFLEKIDSQGNKKAGEGLRTFESFALQLLRGAKATPELIAWANAQREAAGVPRLGNSTTYSAALLKWNPLTLRMIGQLGQHGSNAIVALQDDLANYSAVPKDWKSRGDSMEKLYSDALLKHYGVGLQGNGGSMAVSAVHNDLAALIEYRQQHPDEWGALVEKGKSRFGTIKANQMELADRAYLLELAKNDPLGGKSDYLDVIDAAKFAVEDPDIRDAFAGMIPRHMLSDEMNDNPLVILQFLGSLLKLAQDSGRDFSGSFFGDPAQMLMETGIEPEHFIQTLAELMQVPPEHINELTRDFRQETLAGIAWASGFGQMANLGPGVQPGWKSGPEDALIPPVITNEWFPAGLPQFVKGVNQYELAAIFGRSALFHIGLTPDQVRKAFAAGDLTKANFLQWYRTHAQSIAADITGAPIPRDPMKIHGTSAMIAATNEEVRAILKVQSAPTDNYGNGLPEWLFGDEPWQIGIGTIQANKGRTIAYPHLFMNVLGKWTDNLRKIAHQLHVAGTRASRQSIIGYTDQAFTREQMLSLLRATNRGFPLSANMWNDRSRFRDVKGRRPTELYEGLYYTLMGPDGHPEYGLLWQWRTAGLSAEEVRKLLYQNTVPDWVGGRDQGVMSIADFYLQGRTLESGQFRDIPELDALINQIYKAPLAHVDESFLTAEKQNYYSNPADVDLNDTSGEIDIFADQSAFGLNPRTVLDPAIMSANKLQRSRLWRLLEEFPDLRQALDDPSRSKEAQQKIAAILKLPKDAQLSKQRTGWSVLLPFSTIEGFSFAQVPGLQEGMNAALRTHFRPEMLQAFELPTDWQEVTQPHGLRTGIFNTLRQSKKYGLDELLKTKGSLGDGSMFYRILEEMRDIAQSNGGNTPKAWEALTTWVKKTNVAEELAWNRNAPKEITQPALPVPPPAPTLAPARRGGWTPPNYVKPFGPTSDGLRRGQTVYLAYGAKTEDEQILRAPLAYQIAENQNDLNADQVRVERNGQSFVVPADMVFASEQGARGYVGKMPNFRAKERFLLEGRVIRPIMEVGKDLIFLGPDGKLYRAPKEKVKIGAGVSASQTGILRGFEAVGSFGSMEGLNFPPEVIAELQHMERSISTLDHEEMIAFDRTGLIGHSVSDASGYVNLPEELENGWPRRYVTSHVHPYTAKGYLNTHTGRRTAGATFSPPDLREFFKEIMEIEMRAVVNDDLIGRTFWMHKDDQFYLGGLNQQQLAENLVREYEQLIAQYNPDDTFYQLKTGRFNPEYMHEQLRDLIAEYNKRGLGISYGVNRSAITPQGWRDLPELPPPTGIAVSQTSDPNSMRELALRYAKRFFGYNAGGGAAIDRLRAAMRLGLMPRLLGRVPRFSQLLQDPERLLFAYGALKGHPSLKHWSAAVENEELWRGPHLPEHLTPDQLMEAAALRAYLSDPEDMRFHKPFGERQETSLRHEGSTMMGFGTAAYNPSALIDWNEKQGHREDILSLLMGLGYDPRYLQHLGSDQELSQAYTHIHEILTRLPRRTLDRYLPEPPTGIPVSQTRSYRPSAKRAATTQLRYARRLFGLHASDPTLHALLALLVPETYTHSGYGSFMRNNKNLLKAYNLLKDARGQFPELAEWITQAETNGARIWHKPKFINPKALTAKDQMRAAALRAYLREPNDWRDDPRQAMTDKRNAWKQRSRQRQEIFALLRGLGYSPETLPHSSDTELVRAYHHINQILDRDHMRRIALYAPQAPTGIPVSQTGGPKRTRFMNGDDRSDEARDDFVNYIREEVGQLRMSPSGAWSLLLRGFGNTSTSPLHMLPPEIQEELRTFLDEMEPKYAAYIDEKIRTQKQKTKGTTPVSTPINSSPPPPPRKTSAPGSRKATIPPVSPPPPPPPTNNPVFDDILEDGRELSGADWITQMFTDEQNAAASRLFVDDQNHSNYFPSSAGVGKTQLIAAMAERFLEQNQYEYDPEKHVDPSEMIMLAPTRAAVGQLQERIESIGTQAGGMGEWVRELTPRVKTYEGFANEILNSSFATPEDFDEINRLYAKPEDLDENGNILPGKEHLKFQENYPRALLNMPGFNSQLWDLSGDHIIKQDERLRPDSQFVPAGFGDENDVNWKYSAENMMGGAFAGFMGISTSYKTPPAAPGLGWQTQTPYYNRRTDANGRPIDPLAPLRRNANGVLEEDPLSRPESYAGIAQHFGIHELNKRVSKMFGARNRHEREFRQQLYYGGQELDRIIRERSTILAPYFKARRELRRLQAIEDPTPDQEEKISQLQEEMRGYRRSLQNGPMGAALGNIQGLANPSDAVAAAAYARFMGVQGLVDYPTKNNLAVHAMMTPKEWLGQQVENFNFLFRDQAEQDAFKANPMGWLQANPTHPFAREYKRWDDQMQGNGVLPNGKTVKNHWFLKRHDQAASLGSALKRIFFTDELQQATYGQMSLIRYARRAFSRVMSGLGTTVMAFGSPTQALNATIQGRRLHEIEPRIREMLDVDYEMPLTEGSRWSTEAGRVLNDHAGSPTDLEGKLTPLGEENVGTVPQTTPAWRADRPWWNISGDPSQVAGLPGVSRADDFIGSSKQMTNAVFAAIGGLDENGDPRMTSQSVGDDYRAKKWGGKTGISFGEYVEGLTGGAVKANEIQDTAGVMFQLRDQVSFFKWLASQPAEMIGPNGENVAFGSGLGAAADEIFLTERPLNGPNRIDPQVARGMVGVNTGIGVTGDTVKYGFTNLSEDMFGQWNGDDPTKAAHAYEELTRATHQTQVWFDRFNLTRKVMNEIRRYGGLSMGGGLVRITGRGERQLSQHSAPKNVMRILRESAIELARQAAKAGVGRLAILSMLNFRRGNQMSPWDLLSADDRATVMSYADTGQGPERAGGRPKARPAAARPATPPPPPAEAATPPPPAAPGSMTPSSPAGIPEQVLDNDYIQEIMRQHREMLGDNPNRELGAVFWKEQGKVYGRAFSPYERARDGTQVNGLTGVVLESADDILRQLSAGATDIFVAHNHPEIPGIPGTGSITPSVNDVRSIPGYQSAGIASGIIAIPKGQTDPQMLVLNVPDDWGNPYFTMPALRGDPAWRAGNGKSRDTKALFEANTYAPWFNVGDWNQKIARRIAAGSRTKPGKGVSPMIRRSDLGEGGPLESAAFNAMGGPGQPRPENYQINRDYALPEGVSAAEDIQNILGVIGHNQAPSAPPTYRDEFMNWAGGQAPLVPDEMKEAFRAQVTPPPPVAATPPPASPSGKRPLHESEVPPIPPGAEQSPPEPDPVIHRRGAGSNEGKIPPTYREGDIVYGLRDQRLYQVLARHGQLSDVRPIGPIDGKLEELTGVSAHDFEKLTHLTTHGPGRPGWQPPVINPEQENWFHVQSHRPGGDYYQNPGKLVRITPDGKLEMEFQEADFKVSKGTVNIEDAKSVLDTRDYLSQGRAFIPGSPPGLQSARAGSIGAPVWDELFAKMNAKNLGGQPYQGFYGGPSGANSSYQGGPWEDGGPPPRGGIGGAMGLPGSIGGGPRSGNDPYWNNPFRLFGNQIARFVFEMNFAMMSVNQLTNQSLQFSDQYRGAAARMFARQGLPGGIGINVGGGIAGISSTATTEDALRNAYMGYSRTEIRQALDQNASVLGLSGKQATDSSQKNYMMNLLGVAQLGQIPPSQLMPVIAELAGLTTKSGSRLTSADQALNLLANMAPGGVVDVNNLPYLQQGASSLLPMMNYLYGSQAMPMTGAIFHMAQNAGINPSAYGMVGQAFSTLGNVALGQGNVQQQLGALQLLSGNAISSNWQDAAGGILSALYGGNPSGQLQVNAPDAASYALQLLSGKVNVAQMQQQIGLNAKIAGNPAYGGATSYEQAQYDLGLQAQAAQLGAQGEGLAHGWASYYFGLNQDVQRYGPIGQDVSRQAYFDFQRSQLAAGYDVTKADQAVNYRPQHPFGLANEQAYEGFEYQRSETILGRSKLTADLAFQTQLKHINAQENFWARNLELQNEEREFNKIWMARDLEAQGGVLAAAQAQYKLALEAKPMQDAIFKLQADLLPLQLRFTLAQLQGQNGIMMGQTLSPIGSDMFTAMIQGAQGLTDSQRQAALKMIAGGDTNFASYLYSTISNGGDITKAIKTYDPNAAANAANAARANTGIGDYAGQVYTAGISDNYLDVVQFGKDIQNFQTASDTFAKAVSTIAPSLGPTLPVLGPLSRGMNIASPFLMSGAAALNMAAFGRMFGGLAGGGAAAAGADAAGGIAVAQTGGGIGAMLGSLFTNPVTITAVGGAVNTLLWAALMDGLGELTTMMKGGKGGAFTQDIIKLITSLFSFDPSQIGASLGTVLGDLIGQNASAVLSQIPEKLGKSFGKVDWGKAWKDGHLVESLNTALGDFASQIDWGKLFLDFGKASDKDTQSFRDGIGQFLGDAFSKLGDLGGAAGGAIWTALLNVANIPLDLASKTGSGIGNWFSKLDWGAMGHNFLEFLVHGVENAIDAGLYLTDTFGKFVAWFHKMDWGKLGHNLWNDLTASLGNAIGAAGQGGGALWGSIQTIGKWIGDHLLNGDALKKEWNGFWDWAGSQLSGIWTSLNNLGASFAQGLVSGFNWAKDIVVKGINSLIDGVNEVIKHINDSPLYHGSKISTIPDIYTGSTTAVYVPRPAMGYAAGGFTKDGWQLVGEFGPELVKLSTGSHVLTTPETLGELEHYSLNRPSAPSLSVSGTIGSSNGTVRKEISLTINVNGNGIQVQGEAKEQVIREAMQRTLAVLEAELNNEL